MSGGDGGIVSPVTNVTNLTDALGLTDYAGARRAGDAAASAARGANRIAAERLAFEKEQYSDWKNIYGDIEENLGNYYKNLTPDKIQSLGLQNQQMEFQKVEMEIKESFAKRGLTGSDLEGSTLANVNIQNALQKARIRTEAPEVARQQQQGFLGIGLGQVGQLRSGISGAFGQAGQTFLSQSNSQLARQTTLQQQNQKTMTDLVGTGAGVATGGVA